MLATAARPLQALVLLGSARTRGAALAALVLLVVVVVVVAISRQVDVDDQFTAPYINGNVSIRS